MGLPNQLTVLRMILTPFIVAFIFINSSFTLQIALGLFLAAAITDWYDGRYARKYGYISKWGKFLDPLADKILVSSSLATFYVLSYIKLWVVMVIVIRDFIITGLRLFALHNNKSINTNNIAKVKTFIQMSLVFIILIYMNLERSINSNISKYTIANIITFEDLINKAALFVAFLTAFTGAFYIVENRSHVKDIIWRFYRVFVPSDL
ncbi:CDP-diacylglycerol--glycerol-3-phosphate 3-phosphatidyltransferase [candidate division KSB1 bacterium]|nr:MAG: CDP-diacylglycerol--glycerol-3-phosphate 3-phosphatidyltransferase [candidate division KSB1 bacterium]